MLEVSASARQNLDIVCDITQENWYPCHVVVEMHIPSHIRTIFQEERRLHWTVGVLLLMFVAGSDV
jgi:hypothetical protein